VKSGLDENIACQTLKSVRQPHAATRTIFAPRIDWSLFPEKFQRKTREREKVLCVLAYVGVRMSMLKKDKHDDAYADWVPLSAATGAAICVSKASWIEICKILLTLGLLRRNNHYVKGECAYLYEVPSLRTEPGIPYEVSREAFGRIWIDHGTKKPVSESWPYPYVKAKASLPELRFDERIIFDKIDEYYEASRVIDPENAENNRVRNINIVNLHNSGSSDDAMSIGKKSLRGYNIITTTPDWMRQQLTWNGESVDELDARNCQPHIDAVIALEHFLNASTNVNKTPVARGKRNQGKQGRRREEPVQVYDSNFGLSKNEIFVIQNSVLFNLELCESGDVYEWFAHNVFHLPYKTDADKREVKRPWLIMKFAEPHMTFKHMNRLRRLNPPLAEFADYLKSNSEFGPAATLQRKEAIIVYGQGGVVERIDNQFPACPIVPVHDSVIVPSRIGYESKGIFHQTFRDHGINIAVKHKRGGQEIV
jgi:hypothetical protein